ncbi:tannase/feruloyl esterase family alpha/beta hydrolase [Saccharothrix australiensis]|uniref:Feruloyl esterase n=1 Tax=Saccharothrix australiensis TaxID=2072 RepID=A0A495VZR8_9PSEU|nr:tannase/feruloyl esterase family alpha/beta hydrolase [Saccharothrix australiensis]RKT54931.1 feruloyl esterase [Saccharothrix australiensis]
MALRKRAFLAALVMAVSSVAASGAAATAEPAGAAEPVRACADLVGGHELPGAKAHVEQAVPVPAGAEPEHCDVRGHVEPAVRFQLKLPTTYSGRYLQSGCGGFCGELVTPAIRSCTPAPGDFAVATTDDGHVGGGPFPSADGSWGEGNQAARDDWAFRAPHVVSLAAKRLIAEYYGAPPRTSYFDGCSNGGREALLLAQRYPHDFDGVIAAAPANYWSALVVYQAWMARANTDEAGRIILGDDKLAGLHDAVLARCDRLDGLVDGQLEDPRGCDFDPESVRCAPGADTPSCLTPAQVETVRKLYRGPTDERGRALYPAGQARGSELAWAGWITRFPEFGGSAAEQLADNYLRYLGYPIGAPHNTLADFEFTAEEFHRLTVVGARANAMSLDLSAFRRAGGKLLLWHGWNDQAIPAAGLLDYYERLTRRNGGPAATRQWARAFVVPSVYHCAGGDTLNTVDPLPELVRWTEDGVAPDRLIATARAQDGTVTRSRPVFAYPTRARYDGTGSIDDAANFVPAPPRQPPHDTVDWVGSYLHHVPGPVTRP